MTESPLGRLLTIRDVSRETTLHRTTIYRHVDAGTFPKPIHLGRRRIAWSESTIDEWKRKQLENTPA